MSHGARGKRIAIGAAGAALAMAGTLLATATPAAAAASCETKQEWSEIALARCHNAPNGYAAQAVCEENNGNQYGVLGNRAYNFNWSSARCAEYSVLVQYGVYIY